MAIGADVAVNGPRTISVTSAVSRSTAERITLTRNTPRNSVDPASTVAVVRNDFVNSVDASGGITTSLRTMNQTLSLDTTPGWDDVTGVGRPRSGFVVAVGH
jgi:hypothetical protein